MSEPEVWTDHLADYPPLPGKYEDVEVEIVYDYDCAGCGHRMHDGICHCGHV